MRRQDERRRGSLAQSSSAGIKALTAPFGQGGGSEVSLLEGVGKEIRSAPATKRCTLVAYLLFGRPHSLFWYILRCIPHEQ